eukprot:gene25721-33587_t
MIIRKLSRVFPSSEEPTPSSGSSSKVHPSQQEQTTVQPQSGSPSKYPNEADKTVAALNKFGELSNAIFVQRDGNDVPKPPPESDAMDRLAHKCVSLKFLIDVYKEVIVPLDEYMTVKQVVEKIIKPFTKDKGCSFIDQVMPNMYVAPHVFVSHAFDNPISVVVRNLEEHFEGANFDEVYIWMDILVINQHNPGADLHEGKTLAATIQASSSVLVALDEDAKPLTRLWCLYEIGSTPIEKLQLLYPYHAVSLYEKKINNIDTVNAKCYKETDAVMIRSHIRDEMLKQKVVDNSASEKEALKSFSRVLKLLLILKPTQYSIDITDLLARVPDRSSYQLEKVFEQCTGGRLICIVGNFGEGKSTIAAALSKTGRLDAYHFCVKADANRQDKRLIYRSLAYQLAMKHKTFQSAILDIKLDDMKTLSDKDLAWKHLVENPLQVADLSKITILIDALDEDEYEKDGVVSMLLELYRISKHKKYLNLIVTTRPKPERILKELQDCWQNDYIQFSPQEVRGSLQEEVTEYDTSLMKTLTQYIRQTYSNTPDHPHRTVASAYSQIFDPI